MACNIFQPHILVIPEDDANKDIANGFHLTIDPQRQRQLQIMSPSGGWRKVVDQFSEEYLPTLAKYPLRNVILMIDFDGRDDRFEEIRKAIPDEVTYRVFIIGAWHEPEKVGLGFPERVGELLAKDCNEGSSVTWGHETFRHNLPELSRIREKVCEIVF
jgi:hypothetical protein